MIELGFEPRQPHTETVPCAVVKPMGSRVVRQIFIMSATGLL